MTKRLFLAIKPSTPVLTKIASFQNELKSLLPFRGLRWVQPQLMHITLIFLGDVQLSLVSTLKNSLLESRHFTPFSMDYQGVGWFGSPPNIRTLWVGGKDKNETRTLYNLIFERLTFLGLKREKKFFPHLTLARISDYVSKSDREIIQSCFSEKTNQKFGIDRVDGFELIESVLTSAGPIYKTLERFSFG